MPVVGDERLRRSALSRRDHVTSRRQRIRSASRKGKVLQLDQQDCQST